MKYTEKEWVKLPYMEYFRASDPNTGRVHYGHDQDWYKHWFKRLAGCGPTTFANILLYNTQAGSLFGDAKAPGEHIFCDSEKLCKVSTESEFAAHDIKDFPVGQNASLKRLELMWRHVTPSRRGGVNSTEKFCEGIRSYCRSFGHEAVIEALDIAPLKDSRPTPVSAARFISESLSQNRALAFLNLDNGSEKQLEKWHWVTIVGVIAIGSLQKTETSPARVAENGSSDCVRLEILDNCSILQLDLNSWLNTTSKGGGFVRFYFTKPATAEPRTVASSILMNS